MAKGTSKGKGGSGGGGKPADGTGSTGVKSGLSSTGVKGGK